MPEEETLELETVAPDLAEIEAEPGVNALGESMSESIDYYAIASEAVEREILANLEAKYNETETVEETTLSVEEIFNQDSEMVSIQAAPLLAATNSSNVMPEAKAYILNLDGTEYYAWFPDGSRLGVTEDGALYNESGSNITGVISTDLDGVSLTSYNDTVTVTPLLTGSGNYNAFRYGSRVYITDYYTSGSSLYNSTEYISSAVVVDSPGAGYGFTRFQTTALFILGLIAVIGLLRFLWRDR